ncbi:alpha/beta fold hydrolase [Glaciecola sp. SC05]|uniref:S9 family peptidase n=1 Tax=Glaciecola sp. SC05 TaxID=1987355 RepID=UPI0035289CC3
MQITRSIIFIYSLLIVGLSLLNSAHALPTPAQLGADREFLNAKISPDGKHLAFAIVKDGKRQLAVVNAKTMKSVGGVNFGSKQQVGSFDWANNERLVMQVLEHNPWAENPAFYGELFAINYDGKRGDIIYGYRGGEQSVGTKLRTKESVRGWAEVINLLPNEEDYILITSQPQSADGRRQKTVHRLNVYTGDLSSVIAGTPTDASYVVASNDGNLQFAVGLDKNFKRRIYQYKDDQFVDVSDQDFGSNFNVAGVPETGDSILYYDTIDSNTETLYRLDMKSGERTAIFNDPNVDISRVILASDGVTPIAVQLDNGYPSYHLLDSDSPESKVFAELVEMFKGYEITLTSADDAKKLYTVYATNEIVPGQYFLYEAKTKKLRLLFANLSDIPSNQLSQSFPFSFKASDGVDIPGYITFPAHIPETQNVPMVTLVHGGPIARDYWEFDREVQLLASQGYAVLRVNFRGSDGYGSDFRRMSRQQWGTRMQQDIIEATQFVVNSGGIDKDKLCIMGASYGGYSAVMSATIAPDLFKCVVANVGVYDLELMFEEGDIQQYLLYGKAYLTEQLGTDTAVLKAQSPVNHVAKLKAPIFLAHGGEDQRVPISHAEALKVELDRHNKPYVWFYTERAGHGFFEEASTIAYFEAVTKFLNQHLK